MTLKIKAWEDSREKIISIGDVVSAGQVRRRERFEVSSIVDNKITLAHEPLSLSERVSYGGLELSNGLNYDYTIDGQDITFDSGVLISDYGDILVNYYSL